MAQAARNEEPALGFSTFFVPMFRVERIYLDEQVGTVQSYRQRFEARVGRSVESTILDATRERPTTSPPLVSRDLLEDSTRTGRSRRSSSAGVMPPFLQVLGLLGREHELARARARAGRHRQLEAAHLGPLGAQIDQHRGAGLERLEHLARGAGDDVDQDAVGLGALVGGGVATGHGGASATRSARRGPAE